MSKEIKQQYKDIFDTLLEGKEVELSILNTKVLNRIRGALNTLKTNWDETNGMFQLGKDTGAMLISIERKDKEDKYKYIVSLAPKVETEFTIEVIGAKPHIEVIDLKEDKAHGT